MIKKLSVSFFFFITLSLQAQHTDFDNLNFRKADSIASSYKGENLNNLPVLAYKLTEKLSSDVEKFRAIYTWVCANIESDYWYYLKNTKKRKKFRKDSLKLAEWNKKFGRKVFKRLLNEQKTICTGYAYLIKELSSLSNIKCVIVNGYGRTTTSNIGKLGIPNHSWNAVQLNNKWYLCDATWSSGSFNSDENKFMFEYNTGYFLADPQLFIKDHFPLDSKWILTENIPTINEFVNAPFIYKHAYEYKMMMMRPSLMDVEVLKNHKTTFLLKFLVPVDLKTMNIELFSGENSSKKNTTLKKLKNNELELSCVFENYGMYDVHLKINDNIVATYVIKVVRKK